MNSLEYFVAFLLIASSGFPFFLGNHKILYSCTLVFLLSVALFKERFNKKNVKFLILTCTLFFILYLLQGAKFNFINSILFYDYFFLLIRVIIGFLVVIIIVRNNFWICFVKIMKFFTIISLFFFIIIIAFPDVEMSLIQIGEQVFSLPYKEDIAYSPSILFFTLIPPDPTIHFALRNPGPFWEPGAFAGFINMAIVANAFNGVKIFDKKNFVFIAALFTTFSTGGYLTFFLIAAFSTFINSNIKNILLKLIISFSFIIVSIYIYNAAPFLETKVLQQMKVANEGESTGRFGSAYIDLSDIYKNPVLGRSRVAKLRYDKTYSSFNIKNHRVCGLTDFVVKFGIPFSIFFFYFVFIGLKQLSSVFALRNNLISYVLLFSFLSFSIYEPIMQLPFVYFLFFQTLVLPKGHILQS